MDYKVYLCDHDLDSNICIASFLDFTTLQCCVPTICLMLQQQGYKCQDLVINFLEGTSLASSYTVNLSSFKPTKSWTINVMTQLMKHFKSLYQDRI